MGVNGFCKTGIVKNNDVSEPEGYNLLFETLGQFTESNPYIITSKGTDIHVPIGQKINIPANLGNTFYLLAKCSPAWASGHVIGSNGYGKGTIWYYLTKSTTETNIGQYDSPVCYNSSNWASEGVWKTTIDVNTYHRMNIRLNTYSDGANTVTCKFWDIKLIPAKYYVAPNTASIFSDTLSADNFIEY